MNHLILYNNRVSVASLVRGLYGDDKEMSLNARELPAPLESIVVQPGDHHEIRNGGRTENFMRAINQPGVDGLEACLPAPDKYAYDVLLAEWKGECRKTYNRRYR